MSSVADTIRSGASTGPAAPAPQGCNATTAATGGRSADVRGGCCAAQGSSRAGEYPARASLSSRTSAPTRRQGWRSASIRAAFRVDAPSPTGAPPGRDGHAATTPQLARCSSASGSQYPLSSPVISGSIRRRCWRNPRCRRSCRCRRGSRRRRGARRAGRRDGARGNGRARRGGETDAAEERAEEVAAGDVRGVGGVRGWRDGARHERVGETVSVRVGECDEAGVVGSPARVSPAGGRGQTPVTTVGNRAKEGAEGRAGDARDGATRGGDGGPVILERSARGTRRGEEQRERERARAGGRAPWEVGAERVGRRLVLRMKWSSGPRLGRDPSKDRPRDAGAFGDPWRRVPGSFGTPRRDVRDRRRTVVRLVFLSVIRETYRRRRPGARVFPPPSRSPTHEKKYTESRTCSRSMSPGGGGGGISCANSRYFSLSSS